MTTIDWVWPFSSISTFARIFTEPARCDTRIRSRPDRGSARPSGSQDPHELHQVIDRGVGIPQQVHHRCADLVEVVRRNIGGHADGNALHPVDQQVGEASRQNRRLLEFGRIVVGEVDGVLIDVGEHLHRQRTEPAFGVSVGGGGSSGEP